MNFSSSKTTKGSAVYDGFLFFILFSAEPSVFNFNLIYDYLPNLGIIVNYY